MYRHTRAVRNAFGGVIIGAGAAAQDGGLHEVRIAQAASGQRVLGSAAHGQLRYDVQDAQTPAGPALTNGTCSGMAVPNVVTMAGTEGDEPDLTDAHDVRRRPSRPDSSAW